MDAYSYDSAGVSGARGKADASRCPASLWETGRQCGGTRSFTTEDTENEEDLRGNGSGIPPGFLPFSSMHMNLKGIAA